MVRAVYKRSASVAVTLTGAVAAIALSGACGVDPFDANGKSCPCIDGYTCDEATQLCLTTAAAIVPPPTPDAAADAPAKADSEAPTSPRIVVTNLRPIWTTENSVLWRWDVSGDRNAFRSYEIVTGADIAAVRRRDATVHVFRADENPELGNFRGTDRTLNGDPVEPFTVTDDHPVASQVYAQVYGIDTAGLATLTSVASAKTAKSTAETVLFSENEIPGVSTPATFVRSSDRPYRGRYCYQHNVTCPAGAATCLVQVQRAGLAVDVGAMPASAFGKAFLEFAVAGNAGVPGFYSEVMLFVGTDACANGGTSCRWRWEGWTFGRGEQYRLIQVPLRLLKRADGKALTFDELTAQELKIHAVGFTGTWAKDATVRVDEIRVRW